MDLLYFFSLIDKEIIVERKEDFLPLLLFDILRAVEYFREKKRVSQRELSRRMNMDRSNIKRMNKRGLRSCTTHLLLSFSYALEVAPSKFVLKADELRYL